MKLEQRKQIRNSTIQLMGKERAFTLIELLLIIVTMVILVCFLLPAMLTAKSKRQKTDCANNLKQIGLSFRMWSSDSGDKFTTGVESKFGGSMEAIQTGEVFRHFETMSNELNTPLVLTCPSDDRLPAPTFKALANTNLSYFVGVDADETQPSGFLSGDRNLITNGVAADAGLAVVRSNFTLAFSERMHQQKGNILLGDGSVHWVDGTRLNKMLRDTGSDTNRLAIP
jgi:competence protein ComGC